MAKTVKVDGIDVNVTIDPARDYEFIEQNTIIYDPDSTTAERNRAYFKRNRLLLGADHDRIVAEFRKAHDGQVDTTEFQRFVNSVIEGVVDAKN